MRKTIILGAASFMLLTSCGVGKMITSVKAEDPAVTAQKVEDLRNQSQQQVDYAMSVLSNPTEYAAALQNFPITAADGTDLTSMVAKLGPAVAKELRPELNNFVSRIKDGQTRGSVNFAGGFPEYVRNSNDLTMRLAVDQAISNGNDGRLYMYNNKKGSEDFVTKKILESVYFLMKQK